MTIAARIAALRVSGAIITQAPQEAIQTASIGPDAKTDYLAAALRRAYRENARVIAAMNTWRPYPREIRTKRRKRSR
jgi:hypothetical protein